MKRWYKNPLTWLCVVICLALLAAGIRMWQPGEPEEEQNLQVRIVDVDDVYELRFSTGGHSGGVCHADGSPLSRGQNYGWDVEKNADAVQITALDVVKRNIFTTTVDWYNSSEKCLILLGKNGFSAAP